MPSDNFRMPRDPAQLKRMVNEYAKILKMPKNIEPDEINISDQQSLKESIHEYTEWINSLENNYIPKFENKIKLLIDTDNNLNNIGDIYKTHSKKMNSEVYNLKKSESVNRRLVDFYSKDYDLKGILKKYFKYIYFILIGILILLLVYKKQHKNKKILAFLVFIIVFPLFFLKKIFDTIMKNIGHFKLDILYIFLIFITIIVSFGGFKTVQKLLSMLITPENTSILGNILPKKEEPKKEPKKEELN